VPVIAIVGAGSGLGSSIAKVFGRRGFDVALVARRQEALDERVAELDRLGISSQGFSGDVMEPSSLVDTFARIEERFGPVEVLEYSPAPHRPVAGMTTVPILEVTVENVRPHIDYLLNGAITATAQVLPGMLERGSGTLLYTTGASSTQPMPRMGNYGPAAAALRHWVLGMHAVLAPRGVYAAHVPIAVFIGSGSPEAEPDAIAELYWDLHGQRREAEHLYGTIPDELVRVD
jgi:NAD(P)-dependent dehydrogenase (short-subunit alcohol dehydrogenase family)